MSIQHDTTSSPTDTSNSSPSATIDPAAPSRTSPKRATFTEEAENTLGQLRSSIAGLFRHVPGGLRKARDVEKLLGIDVKLSWQLFKLVSQSNTLSITPHIPSAPSIKRLLNAAATHGIDENAIAEVRKAYAQFEQLIDVHAGERVSFDAMTRGLTDDEESFQADLAHRKNIFIGYRHYYGAQIDTHMTTLIVHPGADGDYDYAYLRCKFGNQRLRQDAELIADRSQIQLVEGKPDAVIRDALMPELAQEYRVPVLPQFCSQPLPTFKTTHSPDGRATTVVTGDQVGKLSSTDLTFAYLWRKVPLRSFAHIPGVGFGATVRMNHPTRLLVTDVFVHRAAFPKIAEYLAIFGHTSLTEDPIKVVQTRPALPFREKSTRLGRGLNNLYIQEIPIYPELVQTVCSTLKWNPDDFDVYRVRIEYPMLDTMLTWWFTAES